MDKTDFRVSETVKRTVINPPIRPAEPQSSRLGDGGIVHLTEMTSSPRMSADDAPTAIRKSPGSTT